ncbi:bifunctional lysylphosphatidylglycerol flippase/synthetase MprF [Herbiconiux sp. P17]|uniref:bifunctional lysylphosphatidylglycerol flippase/synthetase MprF n=1 Tax=Herbiconiux wuyangfengii TaxID=3342794 RepID=UPI0035BA30C2
MTHDETLTSAPDARRRLLHETARRARSVPVTWVVLALVLAASIVRMSMHPGRTRGGMDAFVSTGFDTVFVNHDWVSTFTSVFFVWNPLVLVFVVPAIVIGLGWAERRMGHWRTALAFVVVTVLGIVLGLVTQALGIGLDLYSAEITRTHRTVDPIIAVVGVVMAASAFAGPLLKRRVRIVGFAVILVFVLYSGQPSDVYRLFAAVVGLLLGMLLARTPLVVRRPRATRRETRTLLAAVVAVTALGPLVTIAAPTGTGALNPLGLLFRDPLRDYAAIAAQCQTGDYTRHCVNALALSRLDGPGAVLLTLLPLLALLVSAWGIQRGRRVALWLAVWINLALAFLAAVYFGFLPLLSSSEYTAFQTAAADDFRAFETVSALVPLVIALGLVASLRLFPPEVGAGSTLRFFALVAALFVGLSVVYLVIVYAAHDQFSPHAELGDLLLDLPERFVPVGFLSFEPKDIFPIGPVAVIASQWVGPVFWAATIVAAFLGMRHVHPLGAVTDEARVRELLVAGSGGTISWMATWTGNHYWFAPEGGAVAYRVVNNVAITTGDPLGPVPTHPSTALAFATYCTDRGWTPAFYSVTDAVRDALGEAGWSSLQVAEETVVHPAEWSLEGKKMQDIRTSINRAAKEGVRAEWRSYSELGPFVTAQIREISELWVAEKDLPEMGFTLGGVDELIAPEVRLMVALDGDNRVQGVTSWLPTYSAGRVVGWTLDFMRRRPDSMNGLMEFLIAQTILRARDDEVGFVSLSGAPLAVAGDGGEQAATGILPFLSRTLEPVYGFRSLLRFKMKFQPSFQQLHLCFRDPLTLPAIGLALGRAYLPTLSARQAVRAFSGRE